MFLQYNEKDGTLSGEFLRCESTTKSGRIYPKSVVESAVAKLQPKIEKNNVLGGLNFGIDIPIEAILPLNKAAVLVQEVHFKDNILYGTFKILNTEDGNLLKALLNIHNKLKVAMVGRGNTLHGIVSDLEIITFNVVKS